MELSFARVRRKIFVMTAKMSTLSTFLFPFEHVESVVKSNDNNVNIVE